MTSAIEKSYERVVLAVNQKWHVLLYGPTGYGKTALINKLAYESGNQDGVSLRWSEGGLNFKELLSWNKTLLLKLAYEIHCNKGNLWCIWARRNLVNAGTIWDVGAKHGCSWLWKSLIKIKDELKALSGANGMQNFSCRQNVQKMSNEAVYDVFHPRLPSKDWCVVLWGKIIPKKWAIY